MHNILNFHLYFFHQEVVPDPTMCINTHYSKMHSAVLFHPVNAMNVYREPHLHIGHGVNNALPLKKHDSLPMFYIK